MPLEKSEAIVLKAFNWSESSRTVVFFSRDFGKLVLVDKGGRSLKSKRGRLLPFARLELTFYNSEKETRGYLAEIELIEAYSFDKEGTLGRLAYASAACELLNLLLPEKQAQGNLYEYLCSYLKFIMEADRQYLPSLFLTFFLRSLSQLGYHPSLGFCGGCGKTVDADSATEHHFCPQRGGLICGACQIAGDYYIPLSPEDLRLLAALQAASLSEAAAVPIGYQKTAFLQDALVQLLSYQADLKAQLKSLEFLAKLKNSQTME